MKECKLCGTRLDDDAVRCPNCGADAAAGRPQAGGYGAPVPPYPEQTTPEKPMNGLGLAGMIVGIISYIFCWIPFLGLVLGVVGTALSGVGMSRRAAYKLNGFAVAGLVLGIIGIVVGLVYTVVILAAV